MDRRHRPGRPGFTLIEVLVAILIIATLVAILVPAVMAAFRTAKQAQVTAEINNLATALASFKNTYGDYPPSRIILCEAGYTAYLANLTDGQAGPLSASGNGTDLELSQLVQRSKLYMRRFWPRVNFDGGSSTTPSTNLDFNGNGSYSDTLILTGSECLAFFLGGIPLPDGNNGFGMTGFGKLPTNPFTAPNSGTSANNRTVPNYEFNSGRLVDLDNDGIPSYLDPLDVTPGNRRAYAYFSAYGTNSYDPNDVNGMGRHFNPSDPAADYEHEDPSDDTTPYIERGFLVGFPVYDSTLTKATYAVSPGPNPYCTTVPTAGTVAWINPNSFQLFSAGPDRLWGLGGTYLQNNLGSVGKLPIINDGGIIQSADLTNGVRNRESDNLTNFSGGRLD